MLQGRRWLLTIVVNDQKLGFSNRDALLQWFWDLSKNVDPFPSGSSPLFIGLFKVNLVIRPSNHRVHKLFKGSLVIRTYNHWAGHGRRLLVNCAGHQLVESRRWIHVLGNKLCLGIGSSQQIVSRSSTCLLLHVYLPFDAFVPWIYSGSGISMFSQVWMSISWHHLLIILYFMTIRSLDGHVSSFVHRGKLKHEGNSIILLPYRHRLFSQIYTLCCAFYNQEKQRLMRG